MNKLLPRSVAVILLLAGCTNETPEISYPTSKKIDFVETIHGYEIKDQYRWLEDFTSEESKDWVDRQNKFTKKFIGKNKFKKAISKDLNDTWETESISIPYKVKEKTFYYFNDTPRLLIKIQRGF